MVGDPPVHGKVILSRSILRRSVRWDYRVLDTRTRRRPAAPLLASVLVHAAVVVVLFTLSFPQGTPAPPLRTRAVTLLVPAPPAVRVALPVAEVPLEPAPAHGPRRFHAPPVPATPLPRRELVSAPMIEIPRPLLASPELRPVNVLPAPPLSTDNLTSSVVMAQVTALPAAVRAAGFSGAISAPPSPAGSLRRAGFENAPVADAAAPPRVLAHAGFGDATVVAGATAPVGATTAASPVTRPVEILSNLKPVYTEEARGRHIEGEVWLQVLFSASSQVHVLRTVRGLGYGLDENAIAAAESIHFRPAERAGVPADSTAIVHIVFQLAY